MRPLCIACAIALAISRVAAAEGTGVVAIGGERGSVSAAMAAVVRDGRPPRVVDGTAPPFGGADGRGQARAIDDAIAAAKLALAEGAVPIETLARFRRVREQIDEGWRAYLRVQFDFAQSRLAAARTEAEALVALPGGAALYADAALRLGAVLGHIGRTPESQAILALALALDPERPITLAEFSPDIVAAVDAVRALTPPTRDVAFASDPSGAVIELDGKELGRAPLHASVALGQHVVVARAPLFVTQAQAMAIGDATSNITLALERDEPAARLAAGAELGLPDPAAQELADLALTFADLDELVLVAQTDRRGGPALLVQRCAGAPAQCSAVVEIGYADRSGLVAAARSAWQAVRAADLHYPPSVFGDPRVTGKRVEHRCEVCRSPWLWGSAGAIAIAGTIAIIAIVTSSRPPPILTVDPGKYTSP